MIATSHIHPMLVHFPIALVLFGFVAAIASLFFKKETSLAKASFYLLIAGTISAVFALLAGILFTGELSGVADNIKETHELFGWLSVGTLIITSIVQIYLMVKKLEYSGFKWVTLILYGIATIFVSITGFFGGTLVYSYLMPI